MNGTVCLKRGGSRKTPTGCRHENHRQRSGSSIRVRSSDKDALVRHLHDRDIYERTLRIPFPYTEKDAEDWFALDSKITEEQGRPVHWAIRTDIHEHTRELQKSIAVLKQHGAERFVVLGDVFEMGKRIEQTVRLLQEVQAVGVWGNHDVGLCFDPDDNVCERYSAAVLEFMGGLRPHLEIDGCLFTHVEPWLDPHSIEDLWYFHGPPDTPEKLAKSFAAVPHRVKFIGHLHRWLLGTPAGLLPWRGENPVTLDRQKRYLVVVHAVWDGWCALFDTETGELSPFGQGIKMDVSDDHAP